MPIVISMTTTVVMTFTDRVFLANYSIDAIAAALPAGIIAYVFLIFFADTASYASVFIAQYTGAGALQRVGSALWQAIYFAFISWLIMVGLSFGAGPLFRLVGHSAEIQQLEVIYFRILCLGSGIHIIGMGLSSFFTGRGVTRPVIASAANTSSAVKSRRMRSVMKRTIAPRRISSVRAISVVIAG